MCVYWFEDLLMLRCFPSPCQVVYSSSARELKMEPTKPEKADKEEDDIDIDAI